MNIEKQTLLERMQELSADTFAAQWILGNEFMLWALITEEVALDESPFLINEKEIEELQQMHINAWGWWYWHEELGREEFACTSDWVKIYKHRKTETREILRLRLEVIELRKKIRKYES